MPFILMVAADREAAAKHARLLRNTGDLEQDLPAVTEVPCHCIVQNCQTQEILRLRIFP